MIQGVLFDLGGTLHTVSSPPGRDIWFARRLLERVIALDKQLSLRMSGKDSFYSK